MVVDPMGSGCSITYHLVGGDGKPTGQPYAGKRVDSRHTTGVIKMNGKPFGTSSAELSADGKTITVVNDNTGASGGTPADKRIE